MTESIPETIEEAILTSAKGMISEESESGRSMKQIPIADLIKADQYLAGKAAKAKPHFGLKMTRCIPPGGG